MCHAVLPLRTIRMQSARHTHDVAATLLSVHGDVVGLSYCSSIRILHFSSFKILPLPSFTSYIHLLNVLAPLFWSLDMRCGVYCAMQWC